MGCFQGIDTLHTTATGLDEVPAWFLRLGAAVFAKPLAQLIDLSLSTSVVRFQWKPASICPVAKTVSPRELSDFRPTSITSVLSRVTERLIVRQFLYPAFISQSTSLLFTDQYAFCPTGSTAALISIFATITSSLACNDYVVVVALDFSKPFDTLRHSTLLAKMVQLNLPDSFQLVGRLLQRPRALHSV